MDNKFEFGTMRHGPKIEKGSMRDATLNATIDYEGNKELFQTRARELIHNLENSGEGAIMALQSSNVKRAGETEDFLIKDIQDQLQGKEGIEIVELSESEEENEAKVIYINSHPDKKFILTGLRDTWIIGFKESDRGMDAIIKWKERLVDENLVGKLMVAHENELKTLHQELTDAGIVVSLEELKPREFEVTPEEIALKQIRWVQAMKKIGEKHFANRNLILEGVSHNLRADYAALALLGEDISLRAVNTIMNGTFREPLERSSVQFLSNGTVHVTFKDKEKEYTKEEFDKVLENIKIKAEERKKEWESHHG